MAAAAEPQGGVRKVGTYVLHETLGKGGYSWVKKGIDEKSGQAVALKFMTRAEKAWEKEQAEQVRTEIKSLIRVNNPHVMKLFAYNLNCKYPEKNGNTLNTILLVLEYCPGGELFDILYYTQYLSAKTARTYFLQMIEGIKACHDSGIVHRDIKPQNLLMDGNYMLKLTDFGLSFLCKDENSADNALMKTSYVGTRGYQAPELLKREKYSKACDMFSAGVVLFILLTGYPPFEQAAKTDKWYQPLASKTPNVKLFWKQHEGCGVDKDCQDLLAGLLAYKPGQRLTIEEVKKHAWCHGKKAEVHTPESLAKELKERHKETRRRRRHDKKKTAEMQNSIKKRKRAIKSFEDDEDVLSLKDMPCKSLGETPITMLTYFCDKKNFKEAYARAYNVFSIAFEDKALTKRTLKEDTVDNKEEENPWEVLTTIKILKNGDEKGETSVVVQLRVVELKGLDKYAFTFKRLQGSMFDFRKIWKGMEAYILALKEDKTELFFDYIDEEDEEDDKAKSEDDEKETEDAPKKEEAAPKKEVAAEAKAAEE